jgi:hypothetical protein
MPRLFGPENPQFTQGRNENDTGWVRVMGEPVFTEAKTLGEAILAYEKAFSVSIILYDGSFPQIPFASGEEPKYFVIQGNDSSDTTIVDIHIIRNESAICPKQSLDFLLEPNDILEFGPLIC